MSETEKPSSVAPAIHQGQGHSQTQPHKTEQSKHQGPGQNPQLQSALTAWLQTVHGRYPDLHSRTYFLPPIKFHRVPYDVADIAGQSVLVPRVPSDQPTRRPAVNYPSQPSQPPPPQPAPPVAGRIWRQQPATPTPLPNVQGSDVRDDAALQRVLRCLRAVAERQREVMVVISELQFRKYLDDRTDPIHAAACVLLPRPLTMSPEHRRGDFDVLVVHSRYGLIVGEVKSVGATPKDTPDVDRAVVSKVKTAVRQLNKAEEVLRHLTSDMDPVVKVTKTLMLPNVTSGQLLQALGTDPTVSKQLCECLRASDVGVAVSQCLLSDSMPSATCPWEVPDTVLTKLSHWWTRAAAAPAVAMTACQYELLVARFCGPATTVDVPTVPPPQRRVVMEEGQAVAETGLIMSTLALYPAQVDLLATHPDSPQSAALSGPPGTGKTVVLVLKGLQWLRQGRTVHVVSGDGGSRSISFLIEAALRAEARRQDTAAGPPASASGGMVQRHQLDYISRVAAAVDELASLAWDGQLFVIMDESFSWPHSDGRHFTKFCTALHARVPSLWLWAAGPTPPLNLPAWMPHHRLSAPLRCPPVVHREVEKGFHSLSGVVPGYSCAPSPPAVEGPAVRWLKHAGQRGHPEGRAVDCERCGEVIVRLLGELRVGGTGTAPGDLQYRDVVILTQSADTTGMVTALNRSGVPVAVVTAGDPDGERDMALALTDQVTVASAWTASGLERRVVIGVGSVDPYKRLLYMSRCTAQLIWIED